MKLDAPIERAILISCESTVFNEFSVILVANGVLPITIAKMAACTPILVPIKNLVIGAIATIKIIIGKERIISVILAKTPWIIGCGDKPFYQSSQE